MRSRPACSGQASISVGRWSSHSPAGRDSSALLLACIALRDRRGLDITAAHFNHRLRGAGSDRDAAHAEAVCRRFGVECLSGTGDALAHSRQAGRSLEAAARELRYAFLADAASATGAQAAATGHTMDDQAETVLLNITRGAGLRGLAAMRGAADLPIAGRAKPLRVVRPMLGLRKSEAAEFCRQLGLAPLLDHTNDDTRFPRNKLRRDVIPILESVNPNVTEAISRLARTARDDFEVIDAVAAEASSAVGHDPRRQCRHLQRGCAQSSGPGSPTGPDDGLRVGHRDARRS